MNGYSVDNYIIDQDYFGSYTYRTTKASHNGCGPIAVYNLFHFLGISKNLGEIIDEMNEMYIFKIPGPTTMKVMRTYLNKYLNDIIEVCGKSNCYKSASSSICGIIRYNESGVPHFVCYIKDENNFRFFNVDTGKEDYKTSMDDFFCRILPGYTAAFTII